MRLHATTGGFTPTPPFDFAKSLAFLGLFAPCRGEQALAERALTKAVSVGGQTIVFTVEATGTTEEPRLACTLFSAEPLAEAAEGAARDRIASYLSLADDLRPFYAIAEGDTLFAPIVARLYGYHQVRFPTPFENACWAILARRTPMPVARKMKEALVERFGGRLAVDGVEHRAFPEPARLAAVAPDELATVIGNGRKAGYLHAAATAFDTVDEAFLRTAGYDEVEAWLRRIPGIGAWSAAFVLLRGLGRTERVVVANEARLLEAVSGVYGQGRPLTPAAASRIAARYGPWQGYWAHYLRAAS